MSSRDGPIERQQPDERSPWWGEHCSRYAYAARYIRDAAVLDVATGTGFGTAILERAGAQRVVGCDRSFEDLARAQTVFRSSRVAFVMGSADELPFSDASYDVVVSMETLEHIKDDTRFVAEMSRVLRPNGTLVLSTPNAVVTGQYERNPFHVREYTLPELRGLLSRHFATVRILGQSLSPAFGAAPFLPGHDRAGNSAEALRLLVWKLGNRLPFAVKDFLARALTRRTFYPAADDYVFAPSIERAHVLLAVCTKRDPSGQEGQS